MQCRDVRELLDSFVGEELLVETNHELLRHIETCPECRADLESRRKVRAALLRAFTSADALRMRPEFPAEVASRLQKAASPAVPRSFNWQVRMRWALAVSVVIAVAAGAFLFRNRVTEIVRNAVGDHLNCAVQFRLAEKPVSLDEAASLYDPTFGRLRTTPPDDVIVANGALHAVDRHSCVFDGRRYAHVVYKLDQHLVSVLMTADSRADSSDSATVPLTVLPRRVEGLSVASFTLPRHAGFVVSDVEGAQFDQIARALASPLYRDLVAVREYSALLR